MHTIPEHITNWNFATDNWQCPNASNDVKAGGKYSARIEVKDGSYGFDFEATYNEIAESEMFTYSMPDNREVNVKFNGPGGKTEVIVTFVTETENPVEMQRDSWQTILNNFKKYTETN